MVNLIAYYMNRFAIYFVALCLFAISSCVTDNREELTCGHELIFSACWADEPQTRTAIQDDGTSVWWTTGEEINVFYGNKFAGKFTSTNTKEQALTSFQGTLTVLTGTAEAENASQAYWAVYPYNSSNTCDGESVTLTVPSVQYATEGTFADKFFPAVATSQSLDLAFYNICGGARFSVAHEGIMSVTFKANGEESLVGRTQVGFGSNGKPEVKKITDGQSEITVNAPEGGFVPGKYYFAAFLPQTLSQGLSITFKTKDKSATFNAESSITVNRSRFGMLDEKDKDLEFTGSGSGESDTPNPNDIIVFADERIKTHCVAAYDTNGDGEISYGEAAAANSVDGVFTSNLYTSFDEFRYFTGITEIPANWFKDRSRLKAIALPENIIAVGPDAFDNCKAIEKIAVGSKLLSSRTIKSLFPGSYNVVSDMEIIHSGGAYTLCNYAFKDCSKIRALILPDGITKIGRESFWDCSALCSLSLGKGLSLIDRDAFYGCESLSDISIPSIDDWLKITLSTEGNKYSAPFRSSSGENACNLWVKGELVTSLTISSSFTSINPYAFYNCRSITDIILPDGLTTIGHFAFSSCGVINHLTLGKGLRTIEASAFFGSYISNINIPSIDDWLRISYINSESAPFYSLGDDGGHLFVSGEEVTRVTVPSGFTKINSFAFYGCSSITDVSLSEGVTTIEPYAFCNCTSITDVSLPKGFTTVEQNAFQNCTAIKNVHIPSLSDWMTIDYANLQSVPFNAIHHESHLYFSGKEAKEVVIPEQINSIKDYAFYKCTGIEKIVMEPTVPPSLGFDVFRWTWCPIFVWAECYDAYNNNSNWSLYNHLLLINDGSPLFVEPDMVDMGLSVKWASFNLGAKKPEETGYGFSWGETCFIKDYVVWESYKWCEGEDNQITKYCNKSLYGHNGFTDSKLVLDLEDDAAHVNLGGKWRMPTIEEINELIEKCTWEKGVVNEVKGYYVIAPNNNSIFLPTNPRNDVANYWSSSLCVNGPIYGNPTYSQSLLVRRISKALDVYDKDINFRYQQHYIRPVCD